MTKAQAKNYILYARKSSESRERQEASLMDQISELSSIAKREGLNVIQIIQESKSAKAPGRVGFKELLDAIDSGKADGVLCWKLNRLSRNPLDGGQIQWRLQQSIIRHIRTYTSNHYPEDNVLQVQVELGMADQYIKDLRVDVQRGMRQKAERGWFPSCPPLGYMARNKHVRTSGEDEIIPHPEDFVKVKALWKKFLSGGYTIADLTREAQKLNVTWRGRKRTISYNSVRNIFSNPFYCGYYFWKNIDGVKVKYHGKHKAMISPIDFRRAQSLLIKFKNRGQRSNSKELFASCITCDQCGGNYCADRKVQVRCTFCNKKFSSKTKNKCPQCNTVISDMVNPWTLNRVYYRCTGKKRGCTSFCFTENQLAHMYVEELNKYRIHSDFIDFYRKLVPLLEQWSDHNIRDKTEVLSKEMKSNLNSLERLEDAFLKGIFSEAEFASKRKMIKESIRKLGVELDLSKCQVQSRLETIQILESKSSFLNDLISTTELTNEIVYNISCCIGSNLVLSGEKLLFTGPSLLKEFVQMDRRTRSFKLRLELRNIRNNESLLEEINSTPSFLMEIEELWTLLQKIRTQYESESTEIKLLNTNSLPLAA